MIPAALAEDPLDPDADGLATGIEQAIGTDPLRADTDGDTLGDGREVLELGTDPLAKDTDGDALPDGPEVRPVGTSPTDPDSDGGRAGDGKEDLLDGTDPLLGLDDLPPGFAEEMNFFTAWDLVLEVVPRLLSRIAARFELDRSGEVALDQAGRRLSQIAGPLQTAELTTALGPLTSLTQSELPLVFRSLTSLGYRTGAVEQIVLTALRSLVTYIRILLAPRDCIVRAVLSHSLDFSHRRAEEGSNHGREITNRGHLRGTRIVSSPDPDRAFVPEAWFNGDIVADNPKNAAVIRLWWDPIVRFGKAPGRKRLVARILDISDWPGVAVNAGPREKRVGLLDHDMGPEDSESGELFLNNSELVDEKPKDGVVDEARRASYWERIDLERGKETARERVDFAELYNVRDENRYKAITTPTEAGEVRELRIRNFDWGGSCVLLVQDEAAECIPAVVIVPVDRDRDLLPDFWEKEALGRAPADQVMERLVSPPGYPRLAWYARAYFDHEFPAGARLRNSDPRDSFSLLPPAAPGEKVESSLLVPDSLVDMDPAPFALELPRLHRDRLATTWGVVGDGLVNFEEYRGVYTLDSDEIPVVSSSPGTSVFAYYPRAPHTRLDPWQKDLFLDLFHQETIREGPAILDPSKIDRLFREGYSLASGRLVHSVAGTGLVQSVAHRPDGEGIRITVFRADPHGGGQFVHGVPIMDASPEGYTQTVNYNRGDIEGFLKDVVRLKVGGGDAVFFDASFYEKHPAWGTARPDPLPFQRAHRVRLARATEPQESDKIGITARVPWEIWRLVAAHRDELDALHDLDLIPDVNANGSPNESGPSRIFVDKIRQRTDAFLAQLVADFLAQSIGQPIAALTDPDAAASELTVREIFERSHALQERTLTAPSAGEAIEAIARSSSAFEPGELVLERIARAFAAEAGFVDQCRITLLHEMTHGLGVAHPNERTFHPADDMVVVTLPKWFRINLAIEGVPKTCNRPSVMLQRDKTSGHHHPRYSALGVIQEEYVFLPFAMGKSSAEWQWAITAEGYPWYEGRAPPPTAVYSDLDRLEMRWHLKHRLSYVDMLESVSGR